MPIKVSSDSGKGLSVSTDYYTATSAFSVELGPSVVTSMSFEPSTGPGIKASELVACSTGMVEFNHVRLLGWLQDVVKHYASVPRGASSSVGPAR